MALMACPECRNECSDQASFCPRCGYPLRGSNSPQRMPSPPVAPSPAAWTQPSPMSPQAVSPPPVSPLSAPPLPHALPGTPTAIPVEPRAGQIVFGLALAALGLWLLIGWIPSHRPMSSTEALAYIAKGVKQGQDRTGHWMFNAKVYPWALLLAGLVALAGVSQVIRGATYRAYKEVTCHKCKTRVLARKGFGGGLRCPLGPHAATSNLASLLLLILFTMIFIMVLASR